LGASKLTSSEPVCQNESAVVEGGDEDALR
jgi:hypothetical protein